jgi:hypothetical protein
MNPTTTDYTKYSSVQLKKLVSMRKIPERSFITRKDQMIKALQKYDENPNDSIGLKKYMKLLLHPTDPNVPLSSGPNVSTQFLTLSQIPKETLLNGNQTQDIIRGEDTQSVFSSFTTTSDLSILPDVVPTEVQYPSQQQPIVKLEIPKSEYDLLVKMVDEYEQMRYKKQIYQQNSKNKQIAQRNHLYTQEGKYEKVKSLVVNEGKPFVKQMSLDKYIVKQ